jgi:hypothetical protein
MLPSFDDGRSTPNNKNKGNKTKKKEDEEKMFALIFLGGKCREG